MQRYWLVKKIIFSLCFFIVPGYIYGLNPEITGAEAGFLLHPEYNSSMHFSWDTGTSAMIEINKLLILRGGITIGQSRDILVLDTYVSAEYRIPFFNFILISLKTAFIYNSLPAYKINTSSLIPLAALTWRYFDASVGCNMRFTTFTEGPVLFEPVLAYSFAVNLYNAENRLVRLVFANYDDFTANNLGANFFKLQNRFRLTGNICISNELKIDISGNVARLNSVYGISCRIGVIYKW
jgi:hypothetical protein